MRALTLAGIFLFFILLPGCCALLTKFTEPVTVFECMESPDCPDHVQRCMDGICTPAATCQTIHWDNGSACNCSSQIGSWTRGATASCRKDLFKPNESGYECMESPGCFQHVQECSDGICIPISYCRSVHWDNGSACNCTRDIGKWTIQATRSCNATG